MVRLPADLGTDFLRKAHNITQPETLGPFSVAVWRLVSRKAHSLPSRVNYDVSKRLITFTLPAAHPGLTTESGKRSTQQRNSNEGNINIRDRTPQDKRLIATL